jgi:ribosomal protein S18 acetylase RimI-like enzyme
MTEAVSIAGGAACQIRPATRGDLPALVELLCALFTIETDFAVHPQRHARGLRQLLRQARVGKSAVLVAVVGQEVVGMATVQTVISTAEGGPSGWIEDVVVVPALRGQGIGTRLMAAIGSWARWRGVRRLQLLTDQRNQAALAFYDRLGYASTHMLALRRPASGREVHHGTAT